jgi:ubiquinone/menaquinone biosynthesis C-methylase UbiE
MSGVHPQVDLTLTDEKISPQGKAAPATKPPAFEEHDIIDYYREATFGYRDWSRNINMHFGYYEWGMNPFNLEAMLENTNRQVFNRLQLSNKENQILDMGCGVGATARFCAAQENISRVTGITLVDTQIAEAQELSEGLPFADRLHFEQANYHSTHFADNSFEGVYAIESACHSAEVDKRSLLKEALRLLKPDSRLVICDGFIKSRKPFNPLLEFCYRKTCAHWSLGNFAEINSLVAAMEDLGYRDIQVQNISLRIAPSALYIPWVSFKFFLKLLFTKDKNHQHWSHLLAPLWALPLALHLHRFGYYIVSGKK